MEKVILRKTRSICPECLRLVDAYYVRKDKGVYMEKTCPEHGFFQAPLWLDKVHNPIENTKLKSIEFEQWNSIQARPLTPLSLKKHTKASIKGCPYDCGLCSNHIQSTCCSLIEVTQRCNMQCPICYASSNAKHIDPPFKHIQDMLESLWKQAGPANVQLSGGEPSVRDDLPKIIKYAHERGFPFVQLNTNGIRLGQEKDYAKSLKEAGLNLVYLQWDGIRPSTFEKIRGFNCLEIKEKALQNCIEAGLSVLLVATIMKGINDDELGAIIDKALSLGPLVRGVHFQPVSFFGRYPSAKNQENKENPRLTIPEVLYNLEDQTNNLVNITDFHPPNSEHSLCSFSALYKRNNTEQGISLELLASEQNCCCTPNTMDNTNIPAAHIARDFVARHWDAPKDLNNKNSSCCKPNNLSQDFDSFLSQASLSHRFTISGMAFQDAYTFDLERVRRCHIHIVAPDGKLVPFCVYNLTSTTNYSLHR